MTLVASLKRARQFAFAAAALLLAANDGYTGDPGQNPWMFRTRAVLSGNSHDSDPAGFVAYSGLALEAGVTRDISCFLAAEACLRTESREIDREVTSGPAERLGSIEVLPLTAVLQYRPDMPGSLHPYLGVGAVLSFTWEKSGILDSLDVGTHLGPALQLGLDHDLGPVAVLNLDLRWHAFTADIENGGDRFAEILIDPMVLGAGVGFRF
jgi:outer membrane protein W